MSLMSLPRMFRSETEGWLDIVRIHPSVAGLCLRYVMPLSLLPALMYAYAQQVLPGHVVPLLEPAATATELWLVGSALFVAELAMVALMAGYIRELAASRGMRVAYADAYTLAAVAPTPLWLSSLALLVPSLAFNLLAVAVAWVGSVLLIRRGVRPLLRVEGSHEARQLAFAITLAGVGLWVGLMLMLALVLGMMLGWR